MEKRKESKEYGEKKVKNQVNIKEIGQYKRNRSV